ncbi:MAG: carboxy terminal-processing peptidase [Verrucomicrobiota bacterium]
MKALIKLSVILGLLLALAHPARAADDLAVLANGGGSYAARIPKPEDRAIARVIAGLLEKVHYTKHPLDAEYSGKFLDKYLDALDPSHMLFLQSDLEEFEKYRATLGDLTRRLGDTLPAEIIFARFMERSDQQAVYVTNLVATEKFTFDTDERYIFNRRDVPRPKDLTAAKALWKERLRFEFLQDKLNKEKPEVIVKNIVRRYARQLRMLRELDTDEVLQIYMTALTHCYDPHSEYMGKPALENFNISMRLSLFGIGALLRSEDGFCKIVELTPGGPADRSKKFKPNDRIVAVAQGTNEWVDVVDMKLNKVVEQIRGPEGTEVRLRVIPADAPNEGDRKEITIIREKIKMDEAEAKAKLIELPAENGKPAHRLGIIDLPSFYADLGNRQAGRKDCTDDVNKLLLKLVAENVEGVILDLRRNGGGALDDAVKMSGLFIKDGPIVQVRDPDGTINVDKDIDPSISYNGPLIILTSRFSASASEILAGAMQDYGRALVVGDISTHGKGTVQIVEGLNRFVRLTNDIGALKFTIRKFYRANGSSTQLKGVTPDVVLPSINNHAEVGEGQLPNALEWDTIPSAKYDPVNYVAPQLDELRKRSEARVAADKDFQWLQKEIAIFKKNQKEKSVSLNEQQRLKEKKESEARSEARKKELRTRPEPSYKIYDFTLKNVDKPGLPPATVKTNAPPSVSAKKKDEKKNEPTKPKDPTHGTGEDLDEDAKDDSPVNGVDVTLEETKRILLDMIDLSAKK